MKYAMLRNESLGARCLVGADAISTAVCSRRQQDGPDVCRTAVLAALARKFDRRCGNAGDHHPRAFDRNRVGRSFASCSCTASRSLLRPCNVGCHHASVACGCGSRAMPTAPAFIIRCLHGWSRLNADDRARAAQRSWRSSMAARGPDRSGLSGRRRREHGRAGSSRPAAAPTDR